MSPTKALEIIKLNKDSYVYNRPGMIGIYNASGGLLGVMSFVVFNKLLKNKSIKSIATPNGEHEGYFKLNEQLNQIDLWK